jgi:hypothetical protein
MRLRTPLNTLGLLGVYSLQVALAVATAVSDVLTSAQAKLWMAIWPGRYTDQFSPDRREVDMGVTGTTVVWASACVPITALRASIHDGESMRICRIEDTPHYRWIRRLACGEDSALEDAEYRDYICAYEPDMDVNDRMLKVRKLVRSVSNTLSRDPQSVSLVVTCPRFSIRHEIVFTILDGVHRASIAVACGVSTIRVLFAEPR